MKYMKSLLAVVLVLLGANTYGNVQVGCDNFSSHSPVQSAYYVGDIMTLSINRAAQFEVRRDGTFLGRFPSPPNFKTSHSELLDRRGRWQILALAPINNITTSICSLTADVFDALVGEIDSITGTRVNGVALSFDRQTSGGAGGNTFLWEFGNGATSTSADPTYTYDRPGTYTVRFTVTDRLGRAASETQSVTIGRNFNLPFEPQNLQSQFEGCPTGSPQQLVYWQAGGGQPSNFFQLEYKPTVTSTWSNTIVLNGNSNLHLLQYLLQNYAYDWRVRGCISNADSTCGPWTQKTFATPSCSTGPGGGFPLN